MKKRLYVLLTLMISLMLAGCSNKNLPNERVESHLQEENENKILVVYFGVMEETETDTVASRVATPNGPISHMKYMADIIANEVNGDQFEIKTTINYPVVHQELLKVAHEQKENGSRPELKTRIENLDQYEIVFIGYPNWNADLPMSLYTFLEEYDFSNKTIIPFISHGGSGFSKTRDTLAYLQPHATIYFDGLSLSRNEVSSSEDKIKEWVDQLNIKG